MSRLCGMCLVCMPCLSMCSVCVLSVCMSNILVFFINVSTLCTLPLYACCLCPVWVYVNFASRLCKRILSLVFFANIPKFRVLPFHVSTLCLVCACVQIVRLIRTYIYVDTTYDCMTVHYALVVITTHDIIIFIAQCPECHKCYSTFYHPSLYIHVDKRTNYLNVLLK